MKERVGRRTKWVVGALALVAGAAVVETRAHWNPIEPPELRGDESRGRLTTQLHRGASVPDELMVIATPNDCRGSLDLEVEWDEAENYVRIHLTGENALDPHPTVHRTEGVDYFPNDFWPEAKDVEDGRYLLWLIHVPGLVDFYYDATTLDLLGSEYDFESPPENAIPVEIPAFVAVPTGFIEVKENGDVDYTHEFAYDGLTRGDLPQFAHFVASFIPHSLCQAHPTDYVQTSSRPYAGPTLPASEALPFSEYLGNGIIFDITVEPQDYHVYPPISTNIATYSQALTVAGGIPNGWTNDLEAVFANLAPPIVPWSEAGTCEDWFKPRRDRDFDICAPVEGGAP